MKLTRPTKIRITQEMEKELNEISDILGFKKTDLIRFLLNRSLEQLKADKIEAGGYDKLEFTLKRQ